MVTAGGCFFSFFVANVAFTRFFCRESRDYVLFGVEFCQKFWQKFLEKLKILAEILRKKLATGASAADLYVSRSHPALGEDSDSDDIEVPRFQSLDCAEDSDGDLEVDRDNDLKIITTVNVYC